MFVSGFVKLQVHVYASSICWRSRSSKCVRAQIFSRASLNTSKLSSGQSQTFFSPFSSLHLCLRSSTLTFSLNFCGLTSFSQAIITVVYLLNQTFLVGLSCFYSSSMWCSSLVGPGSRVPQWLSKCCFFSGSVSFRMDWKRLRISLPLSRSWLHLFIRWVPRSC